jgi:hypothetical protein
MKNKIGLTLVTIISLLQSCSKQEYVNIPKNADGSALITTVASTTNTGITTLDDGFTVTATLPNAKAGDVMTTELLAQQIPAGGSAYQLLPITGTQKTVTVGSDLKAAVTYTRAQALLVNPNDVVTVTYAGKTESALTSIALTKATSVKGPLYATKAVNIYRNAGAAYFDVTVSPKAAAYTGTVTVLKKNGIALAWSSASYAYGTQVPISGDDYAVGKDTMYYAFVSKVGNYSDTVKMTVFANDPLFQLTKSGTMALGATTGGVNMLDNSAVAASTSDKAIIGVTAASLQITAGAAWAAVSGNSISFVPSTTAVYDANKSEAIKALFDAGTASATIDPIAGVPVNIFKIVNGANTYYGILKITSVVPGTSVAYEYKVGNTYAQLAILK